MAAVCLYRTSHWHCSPPWQHHSETRKKTYYIWQRILTAWLTACSSHQHRTCMPTRKNRQLAVIVMHHCGNNFQYFYIPIDCQTGVTTFAGKPSICLSWEMWISHGNSLLLGLHYWAGEHQTRPSEGPTSTQLVQTPRLEAAPMLFGFN